MANKDVRDADGESAIMDNLRSRADDRFSVSITEEMERESTQKEKNLSSSVAKEKLKNVVRRSQEADTIMEVLPEVTLMETIKVSAIVNPRSAVSMDVNVVVDFPEEVKEQDRSAVSEIIRNYVESNLNMVETLPEMIRESLVRYGSHTKVILPPTAMKGIFEASTVALESFDAHSAQLEAGGHLGMIKNQSINDGLIEFTDSIHSITSADRRAESALFSSKRVFGFESLYDGTDGEVQFIEEPKELNADYHPNILTMPAGSVIEIYPPGRTDMPLGYYILLDESGNPVNPHHDKDHVEQLNKLRDGDVSLTETAKALGIKTEEHKEVSSKFMAQEYSRLITRRIKESVREGQLGAEVDIGEPNDIFMMLFTRHLQKKKTKLLYVDSSLVTHVVFNRSRDGIGESLIEKGKFYLSMMASMVMIDFNASFNNNIPLTTLNIRLDEDDDDPANTVEGVIAAYSEMANKENLVGVFDPKDFFTQLYRSSVRVKVDGGDRYPGTSTEIEKTERGNFQVDDTFYERLKKGVCNLFNVPVEYVDQAMRGDLATGIETNNQLFARAVRGDQLITEKYASDFIGKACMWSGKLRKEVFEALEKTENPTQDLVSRIFDGVRIKLPEPDSTRIESLLEAFNKANEFAEAITEAYINRDMFDGLLPNAEYFEEAIVGIRYQLKAAYLREYIRDNNLAPDMEKLLFTDGPSSFSSVAIEHTKAIMKQISPIMKKMVRGEHKFDADIEKLMEKLENQEDEDDIENASVDDSTESDIVDPEADDVTPDDDGLGDDIDDSALEPESDSSVDL